MDFFAQADEYSVSGACIIQGAMGSRQGYPQLLT